MNSLGKTLAERTNEENRQVYEDILEILTRPKVGGGYGYCKDCAKKAIELFCTQQPPGFAGAGRLL